MRIDARTTDKGTHLLFTGEGGPDSVTLRHADTAKLTVPEGIDLLVGKLSPVPDEVFIVLVGDETDEDLSLYEEVLYVEGYSEPVDPE